VLAGSCGGLIALTIGRSGCARDAQAVVWAPAVGTDGMQTAGALVEQAIGMSRCLFQRVLPRLARA